MKIMNCLYTDLCVDMKDLEFGSVGRGSFAAVHHGTWKGTEVALKRSECLVVAMSQLPTCPRRFLF